MSIRRVISDSDWWILTSASGLLIESVAICLKGPMDPLLRENAVKALVASGAIDDYCQTILDQERVSMDKKLAESRQRRRHDAARLFARPNA